MEKCEDNLERVQKSAFKIILGESYVSYDNAKGFEVTRLQIFLLISGLRGEMHKYFLPAYNWQNSKQLQLSFMSLICVRNN